jgi:hypothetical protein
MGALHETIRDQRCAAITYAAQDGPRRIYFTPSAAPGHPASRDPCRAVPG